MKSAVRAPEHEDAIAPVTIYDAEGRVLRIVPATEFHRPAAAPRGHWHERRRAIPRPGAGGTEPRE